MPALDKIHPIADFFQYNQRMKTQASLAPNLMPVQLVAFNSNKLEESLVT